MMVSLSCRFLKISLKTGVLLCDPTLTMNKTTMIRPFLTNRSAVFNVSYYSGKKTNSHHNKKDDFRR